MGSDIRRCEKCGYETQEKILKCPQCERRLVSPKQIRRIGWVLLLIGLFLIGLMGTITYNLAPSLLQPGNPDGGMNFTGTKEQGQLIVGLFGLVIAFGVISLVNGVWQIKTGSRNKWILAISFVFIVALVVTVWFVRQSLSG